MTKKDKWNGKPRDMWTWNVDEYGEVKDLARRQVVYVIPEYRNPLRPVIVLEDCNPVLYLHCSDKEPAEAKLATYRQVQEWLKGHMDDREWRLKDRRCNTLFLADDGDMPAAEILVRREGDAYWSAPTLEFMYRGDE